MCGIAGIFSFDGRPVEPARLAAMAARLRHRGPDGEGFHCAGAIGLAHARLSIIDLAGGAQPIGNEDGTIQVVFNGEIFNYLELREGLEALGHRFTTRSDTEVIVHLYEERGDAFVRELNGQFAVALWDGRARRLLLVRDRVGIAPLYYMRQGEELLFASEVKALLAVMREPPRPNLRALDQLFTFWAPVAPESLFEGISELPPGEMAEVTQAGVITRRYWDFTFPENGDFQGDETRLAEELRSLLADATRIRLRADVPVGAYLSGGLDSSIVAALIRSDERVALRTFSIGFDPGPYDETGYQQAMVDHIGSRHSRLSCGGETIARALSETVWHAEAPLLRTAPAPMRLLSGFVREEGFRVVLTGEGADEVLGGYDLFKESKVRRFWSARPGSAWRPLLLRRLYPYLDWGGQGQAYLEAFFGQAVDDPDHPWFSHLPRWMTTAQCKFFFSAEMRERLAGSDPYGALAARLPEPFARWHPFNRAQYLEAKLLMGGYLLASQGDRMLMANGVEGRFPYLDHRLIEFAAALHPNLKMKVLREKYLLKKAMSGYLPPAVLQRPKQPYRAPDKAAFMAAGNRYFEVMEPAVIRDYGYFDESKVTMLMRKVTSGRSLGYRDNMALTGILTTQLWHHHFIAGFQRNREERGSAEGTRYVIH